MRIAKAAVRAGVVLAGAAAAMAGVSQQPAAAAVVTSSTVLASCGGIYSNCTDTGYYANTPASATSNFIGGAFPGGNPALDSFTSAFNSWNSANNALTNSPYGTDWTLINGGSLNLTLSASIGLSAGAVTGGLSPVIVTLSQNAGYRGPSLSQLVWTQGLFTNYTPTGGTLATPMTTLDTYSLSHSSAGSNGAFTNSCVPIPGQKPGANNTTPATIGAVTANYAYCDPIYPFQYASSQNGTVLDGVTLSTDFFYDGPQGAWPNDAFRAIALLSTVTFVTNASGVITGRDLTVYQGIDYGFTLSVGTAVPEPATLALLAFAVPMVAAVRRRRAA